MAHDAHDWERQRLGGETNAPRSVTAPPAIPMATTADGQMFVLAMANHVCRLLPPGWELRLCMENGAAWVTLHNPDGDGLELPDAGDRSLEQQVDAALRMVIGGW